MMLFCKVTTLPYVIAIIIYFSAGCHFGNALGTAFAAHEQNCSSDLTYTEQYCLVNSSEWECLRQRALAQDFERCVKHRATPTLPPAIHCAHAEICVFAIPEEVDLCGDTIDNKDKCIGGGDDSNFTCTVKNVVFQTPCYRSLVHCPSTHLQHCLGTSLLASIMDELHICYAEYGAILGNQTTWALVDQAHFNNISRGYGSITILRQNCADPSPTYSWGWIFLVPLFIISLIVIIVYLRRKWTTYTHCPEPSDSSDDPIAREMAKAFAVGDSMTMIEIPQTPPEVAERFSINYTYTTTTNPTEHTECISDAPDSSIPDEITAANNDTLMIDRPSDSELLNFISCGSCIAGNTNFEELSSIDADGLGKLPQLGGCNGSGSNDLHLTNIPIKSPLMSCSSCGSGFDASRPGGLATIVPSSMTNLYTNDASGTTEILRSSAFSEDSPFSMPSTSGGESVYQNVDADKSALTSQFHDYTNSDVVEKTFLKSLIPETTGYLKKSIDVQSCGTQEALPVVKITSEASLDSSENNDDHARDDALVRTDCEKHAWHSDECSEQKSVNLCNPNYVYFRPSDNQPSSM